MSSLALAGLPLLLGLALAALLASLAAWAALRAFLQKRARHYRTGQLVIAFFHPFCNSGGGGERVLWQYVRTLQQADKAQRIVIYTGDQESGAEILQRAQDRFNLPPIAGAAPVEFVRLQYRHLITAERWPRFTMFGQSLGSVVLAFEALWKCPPSLFIDTTGFAFTYPLARYLFGVDVHCYTHYPTISSDMLALVFERRESYNNVGAVARSPLKARVKWIYYKLFAFCYSRAGRAAGSVFVNSTWTRRHIDDLWNMPERTRIVFPPCDTASLRSLPLGQITRLSELSSPRSSSSKSSPVREDIIISIGQFRPEKDHALQLRAFQQFRRQLLEIEKACASKAQDRLASRFKLVLIGGARDAGDRQRVEELKKLAVELDIAEFVQFELNVPFSELKQWLARATVGLHTMWNEHFGIGVVEFMAAGVITIAHNSGGPQSDILVPLPSGQSVGYLESTAAGYARAMVEILAEEARGSEEQQRMREAARARASEFSDDVFDKQLQKHLMPFVQQCKSKSQPA